MLIKDWAIFRKIKAGLLNSLGFPGGVSGKEPACQCRRRNKTQVRSLGPKDPLEEDVATETSILAWRLPRTEESGRLQSIESQRVRHG